MSEAIAEAGYGPAVPRPPIGFSIDVPDHWVVLDLNPATWEGWLHSFLNQRPGFKSVSELERDLARAALLNLLTKLEEDRVFMAAILPARVQRQSVSASGTLAWRKMEGIEAIRVAGLKQILLRSADAPPLAVEEVSLPVGPAVKASSRELVQGRSAAVFQYFVPVLDSQWLAVITCSTGNVALEKGVEVVARGMASSLRFKPEQ
ncbi:MAG: hypothetical protein ACT4OM_07540 [Actinomycetota bacterium]